jgi:hypothetical protein
MRTRALGIAAAAAAVAALAVAFWPGGATAPAFAGETEPQGRAARPAPEPDASAARREAPAPAHAKPASTAFGDALATLTAAIRAGHAAQAAATVRRLVRIDEGARSEAYAALLADDTPGAQRRALAMILGTLAIEGVDEVLLAAVDQFRGEPDTLIALIAGLGALRDPPDDDDVFDMNAAPHFAVHGPGGMGVTVRNVIRDPAVEAKLGELLLDREQRGVRLAAANALQFSVDRDFTRIRFRTALAAEMDDAVAALLGQNLGLWTRRKQGEEAQHIVDEVVQASGRPGFDEYRLRMETALHESSFHEDTMTQLRTWSQPGMSYELRTYAYSLLLGQQPVDPQSRAAIVRAAAGDPDRAIQDHALGLLARLPAGADSVAALRGVLAGSPDWSLRSSALRSLALLLRGAERDAALRQALTDVDARVTRLAQRLLGGR